MLQLTALKASGSNVLFMDACVTSWAFSLESAQEGAQRMFLMHPEAAVVEIARFESDPQIPGYVRFAEVVEEVVR